MDEDDIIRVRGDGSTEIRKNKKWKEIFNFNMTIIRAVTGGPDRGGPIVRLNAPADTEVHTGYIPEESLFHPVSLQKAIKTTMPNTSGLCFTVGRQELGIYWKHQFKTYFESCFNTFGYVEKKISSVDRLGWQDESCYVLNQHLHLDCDGQVIAEVDRKSILLRNHLGNIPVSPLSDLTGGSEACKQLYALLDKELPKATYMAAVMLGGVAVMAVHYSKVKSLFHQVPVPLLVGQPNSNKTFLSKVCAAIMGGLHRCAIFQTLTMARMAELLGSAPFFVYNDPDKPDILKTLISKAFEDGITSNCLKDITPNTVPLITANAFVMHGLLGHGMREIGRLAILPLTEEAGPHLDPQIDCLMDKAGCSIATLVAIGQGIGVATQKRVATFITYLADILPHVDTAQRIAANYGILAALTELFVSAFGIPVSPQDILQYIKDVVIPRAVNAHQLPSDNAYDDEFLELLSSAKQQLPAQEFYQIVRPVLHKNLPCIGVRVTAFHKLMSERQSRVQITKTKMNQQIKEIGGRSGSFKAEDGTVKSATIIPQSAVPEELLNQIIEGFEEIPKKHRGRPKKTKEKDCIKDAVGELEDEVRMDAESEDISTVLNQQAVANQREEPNMAEISSGDGVVMNTTQTIGRKKITVPDVQEKAPKKTSGGSTAKTSTREEDYQLTNSQAHHLDESSKNKDPNKTLGSPWEADFQLMNSRADQSDESSDQETPAANLSKMIESIEISSAKKHQDDLRKTIESLKKPKEKKERKKRTEEEDNTPCSLCNKTFKRTDLKRNPWIACDKCGLWVHGICVKLTKKEIRTLANRSWLCDECNDL